MPVQTYLRPTTYPARKNMWKLRQLECATSHAAADDRHKYGLWKNGRAHNLQYTLRRMPILVILDRGRLWIRWHSRICLNRARWTFFWQCKEYIKIAEEYAKQFRVRFRPPTISCLNGVRFHIVWRDLNIIPEVDRSRSISLQEGRRIICFVNNPKERNNSKEHKLCNLRQVCFSRHVHFLCKG
jgi:hypothetical protein